MRIDFERIAAAAVDGFLSEEASRNSRPEGSHRRLGGARAIALGMTLALAARVAYGRARKLDLERLAGAVESRLRD